MASKIRKTTKGSGPTGAVASTIQFPKAPRRETNPAVVDVLPRAAEIKEVSGGPGPQRSTSNAEQSSVELIRNSLIADKCLVDVATHVDDSDDQFSDEDDLDGDALLTSDHIPNPTQPPPPLTLTQDEHENEHKVLREEKAEVPKNPRISTKVVFSSKWSNGLRVEPGIHGAMLRDWHGRHCVLNGKRNVLPVIPNGCTMDELNGKTDGPNVWVCDTLRNEPNECAYSLKYVENEAKN